MTELCQALIATACAMQPAGLNRGTAGNVSVRAGDGFFITPTGMPYAALKAEDIPHMQFDGSHQEIPVRVAGKSLAASGSSRCFSAASSVRNAAC